MKKILVVLLAIVLACVVLSHFFGPGLVAKWARKSDRKAAELREKSICLEDHEIVYLEGGHGEPILMVHGFSADKDNWTPFAKFITPAYRVLAPDLPGLGDSTYLEDAAYGIADQARMLDKLVDAAGLTKLHIVGSSMGGHIAARYAIMHPAKVLTLGLIGSAGVKSPVPSELATRLSKGERNPLIPTSVHEFDLLLKFVFVAPPEIPGFAKKFFLDEALKHKAGNERIFKQLVTDLEALEPDLGKIKARTFVLWGDNDRCLDVSCVPVLQQGVPDCTAVIMKACGHVPMLERPHEAAAHYLAFLKKK